MTCDDALLATLSRPGDRGALADFIERNQATVYRTCYGVLRRSDLAEDAAQETFLSVLRRGDSVRDSGAARGWLHRVAVNASLQLLRGERRRSKRDRQAGLERERTRREAPAPGSAQETDRTELRRRIELLPARWRLPILLRYEEGLSYAEIADALGCPEGTVAYRLHEGLAKLRAALAAVGVILPAGEVEAAIGTLVPHAVPLGLSARLQALATAPSIPTVPGPRPAIAQPGRFTSAGATGVAAFALLVGLAATIASMATRPEVRATPVVVARNDASDAPARAGEFPGRVDPPAVAQGNAGAGPALAGNAPAAAAPTGPRGRVIDGESGRPIAGASVVLQPTAGKDVTNRRRVTVTDAAGCFQLEPLDEPGYPKMYAVFVRASGWAARRFDLAGVGDQLERDWPVLPAWEVVLLVRGPNGELVDEGLGFWVSVDTSSGNHSWEAAIDRPERSSTTGKDETPSASSGFDEDRRVRRIASATYLLGGLSPETDPPRGLSILLRHRDYAPRLIDGFAERVISGRRVEIAVTLDRGAAMAGTARDQGGRALAGVDVALWSVANSDASRIKRARTDHEGRFRVSGLSAGEHLVWAEGGEWSFDRPLNLTIAADETRELDLAVPAGGVLEGIVTLPDGRPHAGAAVEALSVGYHPVPGRYWFARSGRTDESGRFRIVGLPRTLEYQVTAGAETASLEVVQSDADRIDLRMVVREPKPVPAGAQQVMLGSSHRRGLRFPQR